MKRSVIFRLALLGLVGVLIQNTKAGSAVAYAEPGHFVTMYGRPKAVAIQRALEEGRRRYGPNIRLLAASDVTGYGAIAVARQPSGHGSLIGVSLGKRSATEADTLAIEKCVKAGGTNPQVKWAWRG